MIVNRFNRILVRLPFFILFFFLLIASYASAEGRNVKVGVYQNAPKVHISESGQPAGIFIDIIEYIAQREGWNLYYVPGTWGEGLDRLLKGEIDLMPDVAHTADREKIYSFHQEPVLSSWFQIYARKGSGIRSILDLNGKRVIVLERTVQQEAFSRLAQSFGLSIDLASAPDYEQIFAEVAKGKADAAITNRFYGLMHAERLGLEDTAVIFNPSNLYFAAYKSGPGQVLDTIDAYLLKLKKDPQSIYYQSLKRWTSEEVHFKLPAWVQLTGLIAGIVLFMSLMGAIILKFQVNSRTRALTKRNKQMAIIDRTLRSTTTELHLQSILENALQGAMDLTKVEGSALCLLDRDSGRLVPGASKNASGPIAAALKNETIRIGGCLCGYAARDGEPSITWNGRSTSASGKPHPLSEEEIRFHAAFPLKVRNETIGMLCLFSRTNAKPDQRKLNLVQDICGPVALAIENARLYEEVLRHSEELENRVAERTAELAVAMEKAQAADQLKSAFLATMSHELRTPLNSIIGFTGIMLQGLTGPLNEEQLKQMRMVQSSARHLLALINDVLDISKIEAGQLELSNTAFDLRSSIERTARIVSPLAEKKGIDLRLEIGADVAVAVTDQRRLEQVILNLLNNAVKFTDKGYVSVSCRNENDRYVLSVTDTGVGIREEELPGLFRPFHQIDSGLARKHEGSGLGLSICEKLMEMMGGSMGVESQWGKGSTFTVRFPVNQEDCHDKDPSDH